MIWFCLLIPIIALIIQAKYFSDKIHPLEYFGQFFIPLLLIGVCKLTFCSYLSNDTEYFGGFIVDATHEEDWNEYIHQICTRTVNCGKDCTTTETYDCSYVQYHPEIWQILDSNNKTHSISESYYNTLVQKWNNQRKAGHHSGYTNSGDIYSVTYPYKDEVLVPVVTTHWYKNKVTASNSVFNFPELSKEDRAGLFEYPNIENLYTPSVLGFANSRQFDLINAKLGKEKQIRVWVLVYNNSSMDILERQRIFWKNGNKNELIIGVGLKDNKVVWTNVITWCEQDEFNVNIRQIFEKQLNQTLQLDKLAPLVFDEISKGWKRKEFKDFDYIIIDPPYWTIVVTFFLTIFISFGLSYFFISNDIDHSDFDYHFSQWKNDRKF